MGSRCHTVSFDEYCPSRSMRPACEISVSKRVVVASSFITSRAISSTSGLEPAGGDLGRFAAAEHPLHVEFCAAPLDRLGERGLDVWSIDEPVDPHVVDRMRLAEELEHRVVTASDHRRER